MSQHLIRITDIHALSFFWAYKKILIGLIGTAKIKDNRLNLRGRSKFSKDWSTFLYFKPLKIYNHKELESLLAVFQEKGFISNMGGVRYERI